MDTSTETADAGPAASLSMDDIVRAVAKVRNTTLQAIRSPRRVTGAVELRMLVAIAGREQGYSFSEIGRSIDRDHSTVINLVGRLNRMPSGSPLAQSLRIDLEAIRQTAASLAAARKPIGFDEGDAA